MRDWKLKVSDEAWKDACLKYMLSDWSKHLWGQWELKDALKQVWIEKVVKNVSNVLCLWINTHTSSGNPSNGPDRL